MNLNFTVYTKNQMQNAKYSSFFVHNCETLTKLFSIIRHFVYREKSIILSTELIILMMPPVSHSISGRGQLVFQVGYHPS